jgi:2-dehydro-3-deoxygalactonokinase
VTRALIGVDWGASRQRAFLYDAAGAVVETREDSRALLGIPAGGFEAVLADLTRDWAAPGMAEFWLCGMVGSRQGWAEAPYAPCPADDAAIAARVLKLEPPLGPVRIAPGLALHTPDRVDVMRGEETQILGAAPDGWTGWVVTPGTHSKWARLEGGRIITFRTWMTGELFAVLKGHSILSALMTPAADDPDAFALGALRALEEPRAMASLIFGARAEPLLGRIAPASIASYLSGVLIGAEIAGAAPDEGVLLVGAQELTRLYEKALGLAGRQVLGVVDGVVAASSGLWRLRAATMEAAS